MTQVQIIHDMKHCFQSNEQTIYQHGEAVQKRTLNLIDILKFSKASDDWRLPDWLMEYKDKILAQLYPEDIIEEYTFFHDCGKPYCITYDDNGKRHFPNHAEKSYETWMRAGGNWQAAELIRMDMMIHQMKAVEIDEFIKHPGAITLLLVGLAEVHANGAMFGGFDSDSFKIKWNQINKRGKSICKKLFGDIK